MYSKINKRRLFVNSSTSVLQMLISTLVLFFLYKYLLNSLGTEKLGLWSLVISAISVANVANLGFSASVVYFVARYLSNERHDVAAEFIQTSIISAGIIVGFFLLATFPLTEFILNYFVSEANLYEVKLILPYVLFSFFINIISGVIFAGLEGLQRMDIKMKIQIFTTIINFILCLFLVPQYGLLGVAKANVAQSIFMLFLGWFMLRNKLIMLPVIPYKWNLNSFKEVMKYSFKFQLIPLSQIFCDPITKVLMAKFGGLSFVGYYEMASRLAMQIRLLLVSASQALFPVVAELNEAKSHLIHKLYKEIYENIFYVSITVYMFLIALTPSISVIWIGHFEPTFSLSLFFLVIGFFFNSLGIPAYFFGLGLGKFKWIIIGHVLTALLNPILGFIFGHFFAYYGVVAAWILSWVVGTLLYVFAFHNGQDIQLNKILPRESLFLVICSIVFMTMSFLVFKELIFIPKALFFLLFLLTTILPLWFHPIRKRLINQIVNVVFDKNQLR